MKKLLLLLVFAGLANITYSQWIQTNGPYGGQNIRCLAASGTNIFAGTSNGVFISTDNGDLWTQVNNGLTNTQIRSIAIKDSNIFVGTWNGVFLSSNNGSLWTALNNGLPGNSVVTSIVVKDTCIFAGLYTNMGIDGVFMSCDNGDSWTAVNNGLPFDSSANGYTIMGLGVNGANIFTQPRKHGIYTTINNGDLWASVNNGFQNDPNTFSFASNGSNIFIGNTYGVFYSNNNGGNWTNNNNGLYGSGVLALEIDGNDIYGGTSNGVCKSSNNGSLWTNVSTNGIASLTVNSFTICGANIFAGTVTSGVWKRPLSEMTGVSEINSSRNSIVVYPNPVMNELTINASQNSEIKISNITGQTAKTIFSSNKMTSVDLTDLASGIYIVTVKSDNDIVTKKIIKE